MGDGGDQFDTLHGADLDFIGDDAVADMGDTSLELIACAALHEKFGDGWRGEFRRLRSQEAWAF